MASNAEPVVGKQPSPEQETTFRDYSQKQAQDYARRRGGYGSALIEEIVSRHLKRGGGSGCVLDLGCGPGSATCDFALHFDKAIGIDPSAEMINVAKSEGYAARQGPIKFMQGSAEDCEGIPDNSVDLITAATAAHWFDLERFWPTAARILKPRGTVAFFTLYGSYCHPITTPHADKIQAILTELEEDTLGPYLKPGNRIVMGGYKDFKMPWSTSPPILSFPKDLYQYRVWNDRALPDDNGAYLREARPKSIDETEKSLRTTSAYTRWCEANPEFVGTAEDCVTVAFKRIREILIPEGTNEITMVGPTFLVTWTKE